MVVLFFAHQNIPSNTLIHKKLRYNYYQSNILRTLSYSSRRRRRGIRRTRNKKNKNKKTNEKNKKNKIQKKTKKKKKIIIVQQGYLSKKNKHTIETFFAKVLIRTLSTIIISIKYFAGVNTF